MNFIFRSFKFGICLGFSVLYLFWALVILGHDLRDYDVYNFSDIIEKIRNTAAKVKVKVKFVIMSDMAKGWKGI